MNALSSGEWLFDFIDIASVLVKIDDNFGLAIAPTNKVRCDVRPANCINTPPASAWLADHVFSGNARAVAAGAVIARGLGDLELDGFRQIRTASLAML